MTLQLDEKRREEEKTIIIAACIENNSLNEEKQVTQPQEQHTHETGNDSIHNQIPSQDGEDC